MIGIHIDVEDFLDQGLISEPQRAFAVSLIVPDHLRSAALLQTNRDAHVQWVRGSQKTLNLWNMIQANDLCIHNAQTENLQASSGPHRIMVLTKLYDENHYIWRDQILLSIFL